ncbi:hypothetical protein RRG08_014105 [Elysia crispata]|uniref:Uncharacterized protein n=1 Tax=Elysia crispata TaxID=231223 RepID=A0AAE0XRG9_9GAST|nr:hypothetical protein RRG08_014105 [Elysia crispata]
MVQTARVVNRQSTWLSSSASNDAIYGLTRIEPHLGTAVLAIGDVLIHIPQIHFLVFNQFWKLPIGKRQSPEPQFSQCQQVTAMLSTSEDRAQWRRLPGTFARQPRSPSRTTSKTDFCAAQLISANHSKPGSRDKFSPLTYTTETPQRQHQILVAHRVSDSLFFITARVDSPGQGQDLSVQTDHTRSQVLTLCSPRRLVSRATKNLIICLSTKERSSFLIKSARLQPSPVDLRSNLTLDPYSSSS